MIGNKKTSTAVLTASTSSQTTALPVGGGLRLDIVNNGLAADLVFFETGDANTVATVPAANVPGSRLIHPSGGNGLPIEITIRPEDTHIAYIASSNAPVVYVSRGRDM